MPSWSTLDPDPKRANKLIAFYRRLLTLNQDTFIQLIIFVVKDISIKAV